MSGSVRLRGFSAALIASALLIAAALVAIGPSQAAAASAQKCPGTFRVLHNDHIGSVSLPKGKYGIAILNPPSPLSCSEASAKFTAFLQDFDGKLGGGWRIKAGSRPGIAKFKQRKLGIGFRVKRGAAGGGGGGGGGKGGKRCPGTFQVLHDDHIGALKLPAGRYWIARLTPSSPSCSRSSKLFAKFLDDVEGNLPPNWRLNVNRGAFIKRGTGGDGFRVKPTS